MDLSTTNLEIFLNQHILKNHQIEIDAKTLNDLIVETLKEYRIPASMAKQLTKAILVKLL